MICLAMAGIDAKLVEFPLSFDRAQLAADAPGTHSASAKAWGKPLFGYAWLTHSPIVGRPVTLAPSNTP